MTSYEMRISDWSSDVCSSDLRSAERRFEVQAGGFVKVPDHMLAKIVRSAQEIVVQQRAGPAHIDDHGVKSIEIELDLAELVELAGRQVEHRQRRPARKRRERRFVGCDAQGVGSGQPGRMRRQSLQRS